MVTSVVESKRKTKLSLCSGENLANNAQTKQKNLTFCIFGPHISYTFHQKAHNTPLMRLLTSKLTGAKS